MATTIATNTNSTSNYNHNSNSNDETYLHNNNVPVTRSTYIFVLCASINSCNLGYDIGVSTTAAKLLQDDWGLSDYQRELFVGSINFWASTYTYVFVVLQ
jgi:hypothetical protein